jgi:hypothetical protein
VETINAEDLGKRAATGSNELLVSMPDLHLLSEIARLTKSVASFGGAVLLAAYQEEARRRGFKVIRELRISGNTQ